MSMSFHLFFEIHLSSSQQILSLRRSLLIFSTETTQSVRSSANISNPAKWCKLRSKLSVQELAHVPSCMFRPKARLSDSFGVPQSIGSFVE